MKPKHYIAIDLKSFYASVECVERHRDPLTTHLVVADESRTEKTICLAVSPSLKALGIGGRARLFEAIAGVKRANALRQSALGGRPFSGSSTDQEALEADPTLKIDFIRAIPRMKLYMEYSVRAFAIYLRYVAPEDIHVYSVDEAFLDVSDYLHTYRMTAEELAVKMIKEVLDEIGITATVGIGPNLYLAKIAMDIVAKHVEPDENGARIAKLDEMSYRKLLWTHRPLTDFWRVGPGTAKKLAERGLFTMGDVARCSLGKENDFYNEDLLYRMFGINAELLIDHAWGYEPTEISDIKAYKPKDNSLCSGQVFKEPYSYQKARLAAREMADLLSMDLVKKGVVASQLTLTVGYDIENIQDPARREAYHGKVETDRYGRMVPAPVHGSYNFDKHTASSKRFLEGIGVLFDRIADPTLLVRRLYLAATHLRFLEEVEKEEASYQQLSLFDLMEAKTDGASKASVKDIKQEEKENRLQQAILSIQDRYGKNSLLRGMNFEEGGTTIERNAQIGGHRA